MASYSAILFKVTLVPATETPKSRQMKTRKVYFSLISLSRVGILGWTVVII
jgi:hypothetical protein